MGLTQASGFVARYKTNDGGLAAELPVIVWSDNRGEPVGYVLDANGRLRAADSFANFVAYAEDEHRRQVIPAPPGWWVAYDDDAWREPVVAWLVGSDGWALEALTPPDDAGYVEPTSQGTMSNKVAFVYDPDHRETTAEGAP